MHTQCTYQTLRDYVLPIVVYIKVNLLFSIDTHAREQNLCVPNHTFGY